MGVKHFAFQLKNQLANRGALRLLEQLRREERLSREALNELNWERRKAIVRHAFEHVPFYRQRWKAAGFHPDQLKEDSDWRQVPVLGKDELRGHFAELRAECVPDKLTRLSTTGGSTGEPLKVLFDRRVALEAFSWQVLGWWGLHPADNAAFVFRLTRGGMRKLLNDLAWWPTRRDFLDASAMHAASLDAFVTRVTHHRPRLLQGYVGAVVELAHHLEQQGRRLEGLQAVWVTSSPLSGPQRQLMQRVFGAPVYDQYGCGEIFWLACECDRQQGLHVMHGHRHVEALDAAGEPCEQDSEGELHITDLVNRVFPIIRYANGDRGSLLSAPCACGRALPLLAPVKGRVSDMLRLPGGLRVAGDYLTTIFDHAPGAVEAFQVRQDREGAVRLCVVPASGADTNAVIEGVRQALAGKTGQEVQLEVLDRIGHDRGKTRFIVSEYEA